jgi:hypothetical protein
MSGALIENIARLAARRAALREHETGQEGISETDLLEAVENELEKSVEALTAANCHRFLDDVPAESRIAEIASVARRVPHEYRYLTVA